MHSYAVRLISQSRPDLTATEIRDRLRYSTFVDLDRLYLYFEVPKAGCTFMKRLIHDLAHLPPIAPFANHFSEVRRDMFVHDRAQFAMPSLVDLDDGTQWDVLHSPDFFRFTVVRNPYTRLQSAWRDKVLVCAPGYEVFYERLRGGVPERFEAAAMITFPEFVDVIATRDPQRGNPHWRRQSEHLFLPALNFSRIGKLEQLDDLLAAFLSHARYDLPARPGGLNGAVGGGAYDAALAARVAALYAADFEAFGYDLAPPAGPHPDASDRHVSEARHIEEIAERNVVIARLYAERSWLRRQLAQRRADGVRAGSAA